MSLKPDDIRRIASVMNTVAECEERAHVPMLGAIANVTETQSIFAGSQPRGWSDYPDRLLDEVLDAGNRCSLRFVRLERGVHGWTVVWRRTIKPWGDDLCGGPEIASTPQDRAELVLRAELARLNSLRPGESA